MFQEVTCNVEKERLRGESCGNPLLAMAGSMTTPVVVFMVLITLVCNGIGIGLHLDIVSKFFSGVYREYMIFIFHSVGTPYGLTT